ncbi:MAG: Na/Pi symporter, partial [Burkholderiales bacterium]|nr:Na/Pi symporter [Burkholderiales bacterium]
MVKTATNFLRVKSHSAINLYGKPIIATAASVALLFILVRNESLLTLCSGICLFLFAMMLLQESFKILSGGILDVFLDKVSDKNYKSFLFGFTVSSLVQSSGLATVIAISFISAGLMALPAGIAMIYGVNLSTAGSAWIVGYFGLKTKISFYAMPLIIFGVIFFFNNNKKVKGAGLFLFSLGLLFLGISYMKEGFENFKDYFDISQFQVGGFGGLLLYTLIGFCVTVLTQSSHATLTLALAALAVGQLSYENAIGVAIGANVGSTIMAVIGSLGANIEGKKITVTHVTFNVIAALLAIVFFKPYLFATNYLSDLVGIAADDYVLRLAMFTTLFNVIGVVLLYPLIPTTTRLLNKYVVEKPKPNPDEKPMFLNKEVMAFSDSALQALSLESIRLLQTSISIIARMISVHPEDVASDDEVPNIISKRDKPIDNDFNQIYQNKFKGLYSNIMDFAINAQQTAEDIKDTQNLMNIRRANVHMASALKDASQLQVNINKLAFSNNGYVRAEYGHLRRNLLRLLRNVSRVNEATSIEEIETIQRNIDMEASRFDAVSSSSLDTLIRSHSISDSVATSIMNDNA